MSDRLSLKAVGPLFLVGVLLAVLTVVLAYVLLIDRWLSIGDQPVRTNWIGRVLWVAASGGASIAAFRAIGEEAADRRARAAEERKRARAEKARAKLSPLPALPPSLPRPAAVQLAGMPDEGPFRGAPKPPPVVVSTPERAPSGPVEVVAAHGATRPKLLT